jgi:hypothetical protein
MKRIYKNNCLCKLKAKKTKTAVKRKYKKAFTLVELLN